MPKRSKKAAKKAGSKKRQISHTKAAENAPETAAPAPTLAQDAPANAKAIPPGGAKAAKKAALTAKQSRHGSRKAAILDLIGGNDGTTVKELMGASDWLPHSVRGFVSNLVRKDGRKIEAIKRESGERAYFPAAANQPPTSNLGHQPPPADQAAGSLWRLTLPQKGIALDQRADRLFQQVISARTSCRGTSRCRGPPQSLNRHVGLLTGLPCGPPRIRASSPW
jgi:hypothetical protein